MAHKLPPSSEPEGAAPPGQPLGPDRGRPRFDNTTRLRSRQQFDAVFQSGIKVVNRQLVVRIRPLPTGSTSRLGLSVSRKVGGAPRRNRVKRCLRAAFRELSPGLSQPLELVLIARPMAAPDSYADAVRSLRDILDKHARQRTPPPRNGRNGAPARTPKPPHSGSRRARDGSGT